MYIILANPFPSAAYDAIYSQRAAGIGRGWQVQADYIGTGPRMKAIPTR